VLVAQAKTNPLFPRRNLARSRLKTTCLCLVPMASPSIHVQTRDWTGDPFHLTGAITHSPRQKQARNLPRRLGRHRQATTAVPDLTHELGAKIYGAELMHVRATQMTRRK